MLRTVLLLVMTVILCFYKPVFPHQSFGTIVDTDVENRGNVNSNVDESAFKTNLQSRLRLYYGNDLYMCFQGAGRYYGVDPNLLMSIAWVESRFNPRALNKNTDGSYDVGIMQINSKWKKYLKQYGVTETHLWDPCYNIYVGAMILRHCVNNHGYNWKAVDCYNKGVRRAKASSKYVWRVYHTFKRYAQINTKQQSPSFY